MALKRVTRAAVGQLTGGRVIHTREFFPGSQGACEQRVIGVESLK